MATMCIEDLGSKAKIAFLAEFKAARDGRPVVSDDEQIKTMVAKRLGGHPRLVTAQHRAVNNFHAGVSKDESIRRACAWAHCSLHDDDGPEAA